VANDLRLAPVANHVQLALVAEADLAALVTLLAGRRIAVLTGAGVSTESGIPSYRGPGAPARPRPSIQHAEFVGDPAVRRRYWARAFAGWPRLRDARPNGAHAALADLEARGLVLGVITQNVDRLHGRAGSRRVVELHGSVHEARCLTCDALEEREALQARLAALNPGWAGEAARAAHDGDADLPDALVAGFVVATCLACEGPLKPDVVFFGGRVPRARREAGQALLHEAQALLVAGTSLTVFSGYRWVREA
jgi:NAD-dependent SIR2 family protein deacetylase